MRAIREDVHIHAEARAVYRRLAVPEALGKSLPDLFRVVGARTGAPTIVARPGIDASGVPLVIARAEEPRTLTLVAEGGGRADGAPPIEALRWELQPEGTGEVHVSIFADFGTPAGVAGPLLDLFIHRPRRRQALRDALWRLKGLAENRPGW
ncbi:MAG: hypothetical protein OXC94_07975 [Chloroflexi bacterium]|nr:hypothetical protein [Chloroflexota bacterium]